MVAAIPLRQGTVGGDTRLFTNVCIDVDNGSTIISQIRSENIVVEGVESCLFMSGGYGGGKAGRRSMGCDFVRCSLPRGPFMAVFKAMEAMSPGCTAGLVTTESYYWINASWGFSDDPATVTTKSIANGQFAFQTFTNISEVLQRLNGLSLLGSSMVKISMSGGSSSRA